MINHIQAKTILNKTKKRDSWFLDDYTVNPYSACSFNCLYCYIRGSKYGEHMETALSIKSNAVDILDKQLALRARKKQYGIIVLSSATDPYLQIEAKYKLTRQLLEVILAHRFPVHIITKSDLVVRDIDLLKKINNHSILPTDLKDKLPGATIVSFSFSTTDDSIGKIFEPGATPPSLRLKALQEIKAAGLWTGVSLMPLIPYITDTTQHLNLMFETFKAIPVDYVLPATMSLFGTSKADSKTLMLKAIQKHYPELTEEYNKFFNASDQMPLYYRQAFGKKMKELCKEFGVRDEVILRTGDWKKGNEGAGEGEKGGAGEWGKKGDRR